MKTKDLIKELKNYYEYLYNEFQETLYIAEFFICMFMLLKLVFEVFVDTLKGGKNEINKK